MSEAMPRSVRSVGMSSGVQRRHCVLRKESKDQLSSPIGPIHYMTGTDTLHLRYNTYVPYLGTVHHFPFSMYLYDIQMLFKCEFK